MVRLTEVFKINEADEVEEAMSSTGVGEGVTSTGSGVKLDFDLAGSADDSENDEIIRICTAVAKALGVKVDKVDPTGPGGGNPNFQMTAPSEAVARKFLGIFLPDEEDQEDAFPAKLDKKNSDFKASQSQKQGK